MSTLMSSDMNLSRPSTRTHAPPGGVSSISFGDSLPAQHAPSRGKQGGSTIQFGDQFSSLSSPSSATKNKPSTDIPKTTHAGK